MIKIGIIGSDSTALSHIETIKSIDGFQLVGIYSDKLERVNEIKELHQVQSFSSPEDLLHSVDAIDITSISKSNHEFIVDALKRSKHVYIENPITNSIEEADYIIKIAEEADVTVQVAQSNRYNPAYLSVKGCIKNPQYIQIVRKNMFSLMNKDVHIVLGSMIHDIDIILSIFKSKVKRIKAKAVKVMNDRQDVVNVRMEFDNDAVADLTTNGISPVNELKANIFQSGKHIYIDFLRYENAIIRLKNDYEKINLFNFNNDELIIQKPDIKSTNSVREELLNFYHSIVTHATSLLTLEERFEALKIAHDVLYRLSHTHDVREELVGITSFNVGYFN
ncbi:MAG: Gfo/Idh/MocA family oxidoreductase [Bacteroidales bacterium]|nr:Gfo/Idh/MocA family oxidoreductase [Bacteroidales bacterium]